MQLEQLVNVLTTVRTIGHGFAALPPGYWDPSIFGREFHRSLVRFHWSAAQYVPLECLDEEILIHILREDSRAVHFIPHGQLHSILQRYFRMHDARISEIVRQIPTTWTMVPVDLRRATLSRCIEEANGDLTELLAEIPQDYLDIDVYIEAFQSCNDPFALLRNIPLDYHTRELCAAFAMSDQNLFLDDIPADLQSDQMCLVMALDGRADLLDVPEHLRTQEVYERVLFTSLQDIPPENRSLTLSISALESDGQDLQYVPEQFLCDEIFLLAVKNNGLALQWVPMESRNDGLVTAAMESDPVSIIYAPLAFRETQLFTQGARNLVGQIGKIPEELLDEAFALAIVQADWRLLIELPIRLHSPDVCEAAFANQALLIQFPQEKRTRQVCLASVKHRWRSLRHVPIEHLLDGHEPDIAQVAIMNNGFAIRYVPITHPRIVEFQSLVANQ